VASIGAQVAAGLAHAHQQGVLHRDIKPANLLLDLHGNVWITDFGLAKSTDQENLTATGDVVGTLRYMAPEVFNGRHDARSEVCALGLTLYELLALQPAYDETDRQRLIRQVATAEPLRLDRLPAGIPRDLTTIVHKAIDRDPARRYQTAAELAEDLSSLALGVLETYRRAAVRAGTRVCLAPGLRPAVREALHRADLLGLFGAVGGAEPGPARRTSGFRCCKRSSVPAASPGTSWSSWSPGSNPYCGGRGWPAPTAGCSRTWIKPSPRCGRSFAI
jgi:hypothetical protein